MLKKIFNLHIFISLLLLEGLLRKYIESSYSILIKDIFFILLMLFNSKEFRINVVKYKAVKFYFFTLTLLLLTSFLSFLYWNDQNTTIYLLGFREYLFYTPLIFIGYNYVFYCSNEEKVLRTFIYLAAAIGLMGLLQYYTLVDSKYLMPISDHLVSRSSSYGEIKYISSIFDVPERFAIFSLLLVIVSTYQIILARENKLLYFLSILIGLHSLLITARRISFILGIITCFMILFFYNKKNKLLNFLIVTLATIIIITSLLYMNTSISNTIIDNSFSDGVYYFGYWTVEEFSKVNDVFNSITGRFGSTSPGAVEVLGYNPLTVEIEAFWARALFSIGGFTSLLLFISLVVIDIDLFRRGNLHKSTLALISGTFLFSVLVWNWKSGTYLIWSPLTLLLIGIGYGSIAKSSVNPFNKKQLI
jgi:hypothetical protein